MLSNNAYCECETPPPSRATATLPAAAPAVEVQLASAGWEPVYESTSCGHALKIYHKQADRERETHITDTQTMLERKTTQYSNANLEFLKTQV